MILSMYGIFFILPYQAVFDMHRTIHGWTTTKNLFIGLFIADIILNFRTGCVAKDNPKYVRITAIQKLNFVL